MGLLQEASLYECCTKCAFKKFLSHVIILDGDDDRPIRCTHDTKKTTEFLLLFAFFGVRYQPAMQVTLSLYSSISAHIFFRTRFGNHSTKVFQHFFSGRLSCSELKVQDT
jgi:hypothetical protein